ncbi:hypothetical protein DFH09DRAFT_1093337 [Mycena vulgaris]|nr:hypothetical protein DFH09DRAFT_1093337 [Mycena vulgaris]
MARRIEMCLQGVASVGAARSSRAWSLSVNRLPQSPSHPSSDPDFEFLIRRRHWTLYVGVNLDLQFNPRQKPCRDRLRFKSVSPYQYNDQKLPRPMVRMLLRNHGLALGGRGEKTLEGSSESERRHSIIWNTQGRSRASPVEVRQRGGGNLAGNEPPKAQL